MPDGTITTRSDGTTWIKINGKWVYQKKKRKLYNSTFDFKPRKKLTGKKFLWKRFITSMQRKNVYITI